MAKQERMFKTDTTDGHSLADVQLLLEATSVGMWAYDGATNTFRMDDVCREMFDLSDEEEMSVDIARSRIHPDDIGEYWLTVAEAVKAGVFKMNYRIIRKDGSTCFISSRGRATPSGPGGATEIKGVCIDVTDRRELEARLRSTEDRLEHLADGVPGLYSYIDCDYRIQFLNAQYRSLLNRQAEDLKGLHIGELIGWPAFEERRERYDQALSGETVSHERARVMPNGEERYFAITHQPHRGADGKILGVMSLAIDITDRRNAEAALQAKSEELIRSNTDLEQFAYVASHDLKAPLRAIEVLVQWLREDLKEHCEGDVQENLGLLEMRAQRLNRLLDDLLAYSRAGRRNGDCFEVDTAEMLRDIVSLLSPRKGIQVVTQGELPRLIAYAAPLEQVLRNLINNAIKHHPDSEGTVRVYARDQGDTVMFVVEDDGAGIPHEYADKVFKMFQTLQPRDEREGSGMGLAIVKRIVEWQGGRIWFHPGPADIGTVFKFTWNKLNEIPDDPEPTITDDDNVRSIDETRQYFAG
jgi:PAS domain S-box-containing protein